MAEQQKIAPDPIAQRQKRAADLLIQAQAYRGTELYRAFVDLLGAIDDCYGDDLRAVSPDGLLFKQGASKQCAVLRDALITGRAIVPKA